MPFAPNGPYDNPWQRFLNAFPAPIAASTWGARSDLDHYEFRREQTRTHLRAELPSACFWLGREGDFSDRDVRLSWPEHQERRPVRVVLPHA